MSRVDALKAIERMSMDHDRDWIIGCIQHDGFIHTHRFDKANQIILEALTDRPTGSWISRIDNDEWMLECSVCGCRVQEEKYRTAVGQNATKCPYCGAELGLGGYSYDEYADRPSQRGEK